MNIAKGAAETIQVLGNALAVLGAVLSLVQAWNKLQEPEKIRRAREECRNSIVELAHLIDKEFRDQLRAFMGVFIASKEQIRALRQSATDRISRADSYARTLGEMEKGLTQCLEVIMEA